MNGSSTESEKGAENRLDSSVSSPATVHERANGETNEVYFLSGETHLSVRPPTPDYFQSL